MQVNRGTQNHRDGRNQLTFDLFVADMQRAPGLFFGLRVLAMFGRNTDLRGNEGMNQHTYL